MESLALGVQEASFIFDPEGTAVFFRFQKKTKENFFIYEYNNDSLNVSSYDRETDIEGYVDRKQLIKSFYNAVINYSNSPEYLKQKLHWEYQSYKDFISKDLKISPKELKEKLLKYSRIKLINFIKIYQVETVFPENEKEAEQSFKEQQLERLNKLIPLNYDEFSLEQKRKVIKKYLSGQYAFGTEPLKKFKSKIIEKYLKKKKHLS